MGGQLPSLVLVIGVHKRHPRSNAPIRRVCPTDPRSRATPTLEGATWSRTANQFYPGPQWKYDSEGRCQELADQLHGGCLEPNEWQKLHRRHPSDEYVGLRLTANHVSRCDRDHVLCVGS